MFYNIPGHYTVSPHLQGVFHWIILEYYNFEIEQHERLQGFRAVRKGERNKMRCLIHVSDATAVSRGSSQDGHPACLDDIPMATKVLYKHFSGMWWRVVLSTLNQTLLTFTQVLARTISCHITHHSRAHLLFAECMKSHHISALWVPDTKNEKKLC